MKFNKKRILSIVAIIALLLVVWFVKNRLTGSSGQTTFETGTTVTAQDTTVAETAAETSAAAENASAEAVESTTEKEQESVDKSTAGDEEAEPEPTSAEALTTAETTEEKTTKEETTKAETTKAETTTAATTKEETTTAETTADGATDNGITVTRDGEYSDKEHVALYIHTYGELPSNYITKKEAEDLGWVSSKKNLWKVAPGKSIGGSRFGNYEGLLPKKKGRQYYECDIDYNGGGRNAKRIVYSDDGLVYYTEDHYESFELLYGEE